MTPADLTCARRASPPLEPLLWPGVSPPPLAPPVSPLPLPLSSLPHAAATSVSTASRTRIRLMNRSCMPPPQVSEAPRALGGDARAPPRGQQSNGPRGDPRVRKTPRGYAAFPDASASASAAET